MDTTAQSVYMSQLVSVPVDTTVLHVYAGTLTIDGIANSSHFNGYSARLVGRSGDLILELTGLVRHVEVNLTVDFSYIAGTPCALTAYDGTTNQQRIRVPVYGAGPSTIPFTPTGSSAYIHLGVHGMVNVIGLTYPTLAGPKRYPKPGELFAHETLGHGMGTLAAFRMRNNGNSYDILAAQTDANLISVQMQNMYYRAMGIPNSRADHANMKREDLGKVQGIPWPLRVAFGIK
jgi:hypothetical protein